MDTNDTPRQVGPVTLATGGATAITVVLCYFLRTLFNLDIPVDVQGAVTIVVVLLAGYLVKPGTGRRRA